jgi:hypothetical protein
MKKAKHKSGYFGKAGPNDYVGPSGQHFDLAQVQLFYSKGGKFPGQKAKSVKAGWKAAHQSGTHDATHGKSL